MHLSILKSTKILIWKLSYTIVKPNMLSVIICQGLEVIGFVSGAIIVILGGVRSVYMQ